VPAHIAAGRKLAALRIRTLRRLADLTNNTATDFGITSEIFTTERYDLCQAWAAHLHAAGYEGLRYWARHDLSHTESAIALFDAAGDHTSLPGDYVVESDEVVISLPALLDEMRGRYGIRVLPT